MKKDVLVTVRGMQSIESVDGSEELEMDIISSVMKRCQKGLISRPKV